MAATVIAVAMALGILLHEVAHAAVAKLQGTEVSDIYLTMWGGHTSMGRASAPTSLLVALAGPLVNFAVAGACQLVWLSTGTADFMGFALAAQFNLGLGIFNLLPAFPLDGGHALEALIFQLSGRRSTAARVTAYAGLLLLALLVAVLLVTGWWRSVWVVVAAVFLAFYLWVGSSGTLRQLDENQDPGHPLRASNLLIPTQLAAASDSVALAMSRWDGRSAFLLPASTEDGGGQVVLPAVLEAAGGSLGQQPLLALAQPLTAGVLPLSAGYMDTVDKLQGFAYYQNSPNLDPLELIWCVEDQGKLVGVVTGQDLSRTLHRLWSED